jgi:hypothetical protein
MVFAAPAMAGTSTTRYAEPGGDGLSPCAQLDPCEIQNAVETVAQMGDTVILLPGTYELGADELLIEDQIDVVGQTTVDATTIHSTAAVGVHVVFSSTSSTISALTIDHDPTGGSPQMGLQLEGGTGQNVHVDSSGDNYACFNSGLLRDSICENTSSTALAPVGAGLFGSSDLTGTFRNVTASTSPTNGIALFASAHAPGATVTFDGANVLALGSVSQSAITTVAGAEAFIDLSNSNFGTIGTITGPGDEHGTGANVNDNQDSALFPPDLDADFRQEPGSPTIDAGDPAASNLGSLDIDLGSRIENDLPDIGADEFVPVSEPPDGAPNTEITKGPKKKTTKRKAKFKFESTESGSTFECKLDKKPFKPCESPFRKKVKAGKKHKFKVRAVDADGNVDATPAKLKWKVLEED